MLVEGQLHGLVIKVLAAQAWQSEFRPWNPWCKERTSSWKLLSALDLLTHVHLSHTHNTKKNKTVIKPAWWCCSSVIPALERWGLGDEELKEGWDYITSWRSAWAIWDPVSKNKTKQMIKRVDYLSPLHVPLILALGRQEDLESQPSQGERRLSQK